MCQNVLKRSMLDGACVHWLIWNACFLRYKMMYGVYCNTVWGLWKYRKIEKTMSNHSLYWVVIQVRYDPYYAYRLKLGVGWIGIQIDNDFLHWRAFCFISTNCCRNIKSIWYDFKYGTNGSSVSMWLNFHYFSWQISIV